MAKRIEVYSKVRDTRAEVKRKQFISMGFPKIEKIALVDVYTIDKDLEGGQFKRISSLLINPVSQTNKSNINKFDWALEIGFLPGVTDNVATTTKEMIKDSLRLKFRDREGIYTSQIILITGDISETDVKNLSVSLANPLIQRVHTKSFDEFQKDKGMDLIIPRVFLEHEPKVLEVSLDISDQELIDIGKKGIADEDGVRRGPLALDLAYMKAIQKYFRMLGRNPTDIELESIAQTWSEHCKHTIFSDPIGEIKDGLFKHYIKSSTEEIRKDPKKDKFLVSVFTDNSGGIEFDDEYLITHKVETHNSPSALDPFGGSITGIVGVNRDTIGFGLGAKPVINTFGFCFADPNDSEPIYRDEAKMQKMLSPRRILEGVVAGVNSGGNCSGIPTPSGFIYFNENYKGKPLVFVGTVGLIPKNIQGKPSYIKKAVRGDLIVVVGGRVGLDGIHGATFSSESLNSGSPAGAVQIGDPITQKKLSDAIVKEARDMMLYHSITDNGAGGLSCSVAEMAKESGGAVVDLEKVPLKYPGLNPWQIWISESQERMTLAVPKENFKAFKDLMDKRGVEITVIGEFDNSGRCVVRFGGKVIMDLDMEFLHEGLPNRDLKIGPVKTQLNNPAIDSEDLNERILKMLKRLNLSSFKFITEQYDHEVQGGSVLKPLQGKGMVNSETTITRPNLASNKGVVLSQALYPTYSYLDSYSMAAATIDTAVRNVLAAGATLDKIALLDNFCWCSSNDPDKLAQLKRAVRACFDLSTVYSTPFISGKDSMFNDFNGFDKDGKKIKISIPPTLLISSIGIIDDLLDSVSLDFKNPRDVIYLLGETNDELGGSEYFQALSEEQGIKGLGQFTPLVNPIKNLKLYRDYERVLKERLISSSIALGRGGLIYALMKSAMAGLSGVNISLERLIGDATQNETALFSESQGRILVTVPFELQAKFESMINSRFITRLGTVSEGSAVKISGLEGEQVVNLNVTDALVAYRGRFDSF